jgi:hypothetical protein
MSHVFRRLVVIASMFSLLAALAAPPAHARPIFSGTDTLSAQLVSWLLSWWPATRIESGGNAGPDRSFRRSAPLPARTGPGVRAATGHVSHARGPVFRIECNPATDPNGCTFP